MGRSLDRRLVLLAAAAGAAGLSARPAQAKTHPVTMNPASSKFEPQDIAIRRGDTVEWENTTSVLHSVTFDPAMSKVPGNVVLPEGVAPFDSGRMSREAKFAHTFTKAGVYKYVCKYHEGMGMVGTVTVR